MPTPKGLPIAQPTGDALLEAIKAGPTPAARQEIWASGWMEMAAHAVQTGGATAFADFRTRQTPLIPQYCAAILGAGTGMGTAKRAGSTSGQE